MSVKRTIMNSAIRLLKGCISIFGKTRSTFILAKLAQEMIPIVNQETGFGNVNFFCPGEIPEWRARTLLTKEPETIEWINSFEENDVLWDIGANVGVYSLYAALRNILVLSFEPSPGNYYLLSRNIEINRMHDRISALCIAFNDLTMLDSLYMNNVEIGGALNSFAEAVDWKGRPFDAAFKQAMIGFSIDDFIHQFNPLFPNHIKIDVDGIEDRIIKGARHTLFDKRVKSVLVELDSNRQEYCAEVTDIIEKAGLCFIEKSHAPMYDNTDMSGVFNYIFRRNKK